MKFYFSLLLVFCPVILSSQSQLSMRLPELFYPIKSVYFRYDKPIGEKYSMLFSLRKNFSGSNKYNPLQKDGRKINYNLRGQLNGGIGLGIKRKIGFLGDIYLHSECQVNHQKIDGKFASNITQIDSVIVFHDYNYKSFEKTKLTFINTIGYEANAVYKSITFIVGLNLNFTFHHSINPSDAPKSSISKSLNIDPPTKQLWLNHYVYNIEDKFRIYPGIYFAVGYVL